MRSDFMLSLKPRPFVQSPFDIQGALIATRVSFFSHFLFIWRCRFLRVFFVLLPFSLCMESMSYVFFFRMVVFYLVTTGWTFYISLYENSINQSIGRSIKLRTERNSYKINEVVLSLQPMIPYNKHFDIFPPVVCGMLRRSRCIHISL